MSCPFCSKLWKIRLKWSFSIIRIQFYSSSMFGNWWLRKPWQAILVRRGYVMTLQHITRTWSACYKPSHLVLWVSGTNQPTSPPKQNHTPSLHLDGREASCRTNPSSSHQAGSIEGAGKPVGTLDSLAEWFKCQTISQYSWSNICTVKNSCMCLKCINLLASLWRFNKALINMHHGIMVVYAEGHWKSNEVWTHLPIS